MFGGVEILNSARLKSTHHLHIPTAAGPSQCYACAEHNESTCEGNQYTQMCATDQNSLGTTHCGSAVGKYQDKSGKDLKLDGFIRGCIQCTGKEMQFLQRSCEMLEQLKLIFFFLNSGILTFQIYIFHRLEDIAHYK